MDLITTAVLSLINATAALGIVAAGIHELHCYNRALSTFRDMALETVPGNQAYFSSCTIGQQHPQVANCQHRGQRILLLGALPDAH